VHQPSSACPYCRPSTKVIGPVSTSSSVPTWVFSLTRGGAAGIFILRAVQVLVSPLATRARATSLHRQCHMHPTKTCRASPAPSAEVLAGRASWTEVNAVHPTLYVYVNMFVLRVSSDRVRGEDLYAPRFLFLFYGHILCFCVLHEALQCLGDHPICSVNLVGVVSAA
jgi:hypothetical protein